MHGPGSLGCWTSVENQTISGRLALLPTQSSAICRQCPLVEFTFDGAAVEGREGEPIAAALFAAGYRVLRTMPRFGDARGGYCMIGRCTDCMVVVDGIPNVPACLTPVSAGLVVRTQRGLGESAWRKPGSAAHDAVDCGRGRWSGGSGRRHRGGDRGSLRDRARRAERSPAGNCAIACSR